jgi:hypothetical protein
VELGEVAVVVGTRRPDGLRTEVRWRRRDEEELEIRVESGSPALSDLLRFKGELGPSIAQAKLIKRPHKRRNRNVLSFLPKRPY